MAVVCFRPIRGYRTGAGTVTLRAKEGYRDLPVDVPCGQCGGCRSKRARSWALRCVHEASLHPVNSFITLTYETMPARGSLSVEHLQKFFKRLRRFRVDSPEERKIRYFACGEYGDRTLRPHYHALLFGEAFLEDRRPLAGHPRLFRSPLLEERWGYGFCTVGDVTFASALYVAQYILKKQTGLNKDFYGDCKPPFIVCSRRPGIGRGWYERFKSDCYPSDFCVAEGRKYPVPKYYDSQLSESELAEVKAQRSVAAAGRRESYTPRALEAKESLYKCNLRIRSGI